MENDQESILEDEIVEKSINLNPEEDISSTQHKQNTISALENISTVSVAADEKDNMLQSPDFKAEIKSFM